MAEDPDKRDEPNLELPSLFSRFTKKRRPAPGESKTSGEDATNDARAAESVEPVAEASSETSPETSSDRPTAAPVPIPVEGSSRRVPPTPPPPAREEQTDTVPVAEQIPEPEPEPRAEVRPEPEPEPEPEPRPGLVPEPEPEHEPVTATTALPVTDDHPHAAASTAAAPVVAHETPVADEATSGEPRRRRVRKERPSLVLPAVDPRIAVAVTGAVVGLAGVVLAYAAGRGCEAVRGVGSCGGGVGVVALLAVLTLMVALGAGLLTAWRIPNSTSTSLLAVGLVAVAAMLFFLGALESAWMLLVVPVLTALAFLGSWWVSEVLVDPTLTEDVRR